MAKDSTDLVLEIVNSFIKFRALPVFFAPFDPSTTTMQSLSMHPANYALEKTGSYGSIAVTDDNPFMEAARNRRFIIYHGLLEVSSFVQKAFPGMPDDFFAAMMQVLAKNSILVLPLETESGIEAVVGLAVSADHLMEHFDTFRYLAKYSAMSLSKQNGAVRLQQAQQMTIMSLVKLAEYRDVETGSHLERLMRYTEILARDLSEQYHFRDYITETYIADIVNSCLLHDIGKVGIPDSILKKPGKLTPEEFEIMKKHTLYGGDSLSDAERKVQGRSFLNLSKEIAYYHHEWYNGKGYPFGLEGESIPLSARIVAVADVYDALRSMRAYKNPMSHEEAFRLILSETGTHFDRLIVDSFVRKEKLFNEQSLLL
jgi:response regulator RpfG family c-di-GMP phosphodiesterase